MSNSSTEYRIPAQTAQDVCRNQTSTGASLIPNGREWAALLGLCGSVIGTGGGATTALAEEVCFSQTSPSVVAQAPLPRRRRAALATVSEKLFGIRQSLSLNISELARVLRIQRPALYGWIQGKSEPRRANLQRLDSVYELALVWYQSAREPAAELARCRVAGSGSLLEALENERLDDARLHGILMAMKERASRVQADQSDALIAELASDRGYEPIATEIQRANFEHGTE